MPTGVLRGVNTTVISVKSSLQSYIKEGGLKMVFKFGLGGIIRLLRFEARAKRVAGKYQTADDGYLMAFATRIDK